MTACSTSEKIWASSKSKVLFWFPLLFLQFALILKNNEFSLFFPTVSSKYQVYTRVLVSKWFHLHNLSINLYIIIIFTNLELWSHWHWHLVYPFEANDVSIVRKDRRGELFYYMHQQVRAKSPFPSAWMRLFSILWIFRSSVVTTLRDSATTCHASFPLAVGGLPFQKDIFQNWTRLSRLALGRVSWACHQHFVNVFLKRAVTNWKTRRLEQMKSI